VALLFTVNTFGQDGNTARTVLVFFDDLHIEFANTGRLRTGVRQATERLLAAGRTVAMVSDGRSSVAIRPTNESATLLQVANRITGGGLKASEIADPTPAITADINRRDTVAQAAFRDVLTSIPLTGILYVTEREIQPTGVTIPIVITRPEGMDAAVIALLSR